MDIKDKKDKKDEKDKKATVDNTDNHDDCPLCQDYEANPEHCQLCHDEEDDCPYCNEAAADDANHQEDDCSMCNEFDAEAADNQVEQTAGPIVTELTTTNSHTPSDPTMTEPVIIDSTNMYPASANSFEEEDAVESINNQIPREQEAVRDIAEIIDTDPSPAEQKNIVDSIDDTDLAIGTNSEDNVSRPEDYETNVPGDLGLDEEEADKDAGADQGDIASNDEQPEEDQEEPDYSDVLSDGLEEKMNNENTEKVKGLVATALQGFKANKQLLEKAKQQAPDFYNSSIAMLRAMIEMSKMLGFSEQADPEQESPDQKPSAAPSKEKPPVKEEKPAPKEGADKDPKTERQ